MYLFIIGFWALTRFVKQEMLISKVANILSIKLVVKAFSAIFFKYQALIFLSCTSHCLN